MSRGPDPIEIAMRRATQVELDLMALDERLLKMLAERRDAQAKLIELGIDPPANRRYSRALTVALQVDRGDAFWDRAPAEPTPIHAAG